MGDKPIHILNNCHEIIIDEAKIKKHAKTSQEIIECCKDVRVLGMKELRLLKKWRESLRTDFEKAAKEARENPTVDENGEHIQTVAEAKEEAR